MNKIMKFENNNIQMIKINNIWYFDLYSVGMALGQIKKNSKGVIYPRKDRIDENAKNAEIKPVVRNGQPFITEEQIYDLMLETRTDKCRVFRKWLTNEVLPTLRKTGKYEMPKAETKPYEYFDKTYNGEPVLSTIDIENLTEIKRGTIDYSLRTKLIKGTDYHYIEGDELRNFKQENPKVSRLVSSINVVTKSGFIKLCHIYGITVEEPKCFEAKDPSKKSTVHKIFDNFKKYYDIKNCVLTDDIVKTLNVDKNDLVNYSHMIRFCDDDKYFMVSDNTAPLLERQFMVAQNLGHILAGTLRKNANQKINYEQDARTFAMVVMAMSLYFDNNN